MSKIIKTMNATLLIVGTSVGAGMLGLPVETARGGFVLSLALLVFNWMMMTVTALLLVEVLAKYTKTSNFISLSEKILGPSFKVVTFFVYIALFLSLTLAYVKGGGVFLSDLFSGITLSLGCLGFLMLFVPLIVLGSKILSFGNSLLTIGVMVSFVLLVSMGVSKVQTTFLSHLNWKYAFFSFPMFITSFGFHSVLPSLYSYVESKKRLRIAILMGTSITLSIYVIWQLVVMGIVPLEGEFSLTGALIQDQTAITPLKVYLKNRLLHFCAQTFYFTALTTSFLGVGLGLIDFLLDSFKIQQKFINRLFFSLLIYLPAFWIAQTKLRIFYLSLKYGGGAACFYLLVLLPLLFFFRSKKVSLKLR
jgi:tyrosine-specific transport protein